MEKPLRARSSVARRPVKVLADGTYLARMNLAGQAIICGSLVP